MKWEEVVCLANSRKYRGKCFAGKKISNGEWIRPVSSSGKGELLTSDMQCGDGVTPELLDVVRVPLKKSAPKHFQPENWLVDDAMWAKVGRFPGSELGKLCDEAVTLWDNTHPSKDRIDEGFIKKNPLRSSLLFIRAKKVSVQREDIKYEDKVKKSLKALFSFHNIHYVLSVTDPEIEAIFSDMGPGKYPLPADEIYMCISLGEPYEKDGCCYKLVASIIIIDKQGKPLDAEQKASLMQRQNAWRF